MMDAKHEKLMPYVKWGLYYLILLVLYALQTNPRLFTIYGVKPVLLVAMVACVCVFEDVLPSGVFAMVAGLLWDISSDKLLGFNAIIFLMCGIMISLLCIYYLHAKLINTIVFCGIIMAIQSLLNYVFYFAIWQYENSQLMLIRIIIPTAIYTLIPVIPLFFLVRKISYRFNRTIEI